MVSTGKPETRTSISVIIPLHNGEAHIERALSSVVCQLRSEDEVIVIDDASEDRGAEISRTFLASAGLEFAVVPQPINCGIPASRNTGIRLASRDLLMFVDQDDVWTDTHVESLVSVIDPDCGRFFGVGRQSFFLDSVIERGEFSLPSWVRAEWLQESQSGFVFGAMAGWRGAFLDVGLLNEDLLFGGDDVEWVSRLLRSGRHVSWLDHVVIHRRVHDLNHSADTRSTKELLRVVRDHLGSATNNGK